MSLRSSVPLLSLNKFALNFISFVLLMTGDKQPYLDGITTGLAIVATLLLAFKKIDNWYYWILADVLYIYLF